MVEPSDTAHPEGETQTPIERTEPGPFSQLVDREWLDLCEKSDRTSDHPDMCLITRIELAGAMSEAFFAGTDAARSTPPSRPQGEMTREAVARIVDPEAFDLIEHYNGLRQSKGEGETFRVYPQLKARRDAAYEKADAILALHPVVRPQGEEGLRETLEALGYQRVFNAIGDAVEWRPRRSFGISVAKFIAALSNQGKPSS